MLLNIDKEKNLYELLEVDKNSTQEIIKKAWKKLALKYHPDKNNYNSGEIFLKIKNAYDILSNEELRKRYDNEVQLNNNFNLNFINGLNLFDLNLKTHLINFIDSTEIDKILELILKKKKFDDIFSISNVFCKNFNDFIKKLTNIEIELYFDLLDVWNCVPKIIKYRRNTSNIFEELIFPIDFIQVYENEGEQIIINNILYKGDLVVKIKIINTSVYGENYYIHNEDLYVLIDNKKIIDNKFTLKFLDGNKYKFNITKLNKITNNLGNVYIKKNFGFPKLNNIENNKNFNIENTIKYSNLFFIIILY